MSYAQRRHVVFDKPFTVARTGQQFPAGSYSVESEVTFRSASGRAFSYTVSHLEYPAGLLGDTHAGGTVLMTDEDLAQATEATA